MSRIESALRSMVAALEARQVRFALVGGLAVSARAEPRFTRDVDIAVEVEKRPPVHGLKTPSYRSPFSTPLLDTARSLGLTVDSEIPCV